VVRAPIAPQLIKVADVLRRDRVEELRAGRHAHLVDAQQQPARNAQAFMMSKLPFRCGSLMRPFHPTVVAASRSRRA
jgi:hypothetical protein